MTASTLDILRQAVWIPPPPLTEKNAPNLAGKVCVVTGGYGGCGFELCQLLFQLDATVYIFGRDESKGQNAIQKLQSSLPSSKGRLEFLKIDLADLTCIKPAAETFMSKETRLDLLFNNAGVNSPPEGSRTVQGFELSLGTNCLGPFVLTACLRPLLRKTVKTSPAGSVRVIWASSLAVEGTPPEGIKLDQGGNPEFGRDKAMNYNMSKAGNLFYGVECAKRYGEEGFLSIPINPGNMKSDITRHMPSMQAALFRSMFFPPKLGAYTYLYAALSPDLGLANNGAYVVPWGRIGGLKKLEKAVERDADGGTGYGEKFWTWSESVTQEYV